MPLGAVEPFALAALAAHEVAAGGHVGAGDVLVDEGAHVLVELAQHLCSPSQCEFHKDVRRVPPTLVTELAQVPCVELAQVELAPG